MALPDNTYSRAVSWLKILLPLLALGILSTLFLLSRTVEPLQTLPYADVDAQEFAREQRIGSPNYSGVAANGAAVTLTADSARPELDHPEIINADKLNASIKQTDGATIDIEARSGVFDSDSQSALLSGGVIITDSADHRLTTDSMRALLDGSEMETEVPVVVEGPNVQITAGRMKMKLLSPEEGSGGYVIDFKDGVKLIYTPKAKTAGPP